MRDARSSAPILVQSQLAEHAPYGGVVPEIAARSHLDHNDLADLSGAGRRPGSASTRSTASRRRLGRGLIGGPIVGTMAAKGMAWATPKLVVAVNHLEVYRR